MIILYADTLAVGRWTDAWDVTPRKPLCFILFAKELDRSRCSAEFFFKRLREMWQSCEVPYPGNVFVVDNYPTLGVKQWH